ncbi:MAG: hypothetical protein ACR2NZ_07000 [Rubripirellula sp.]
MHLPVLPLALMIAMTVLVDAPRVSAATFRVTTKIFVGAELDAASEHLILFDEGLVYDLPQIETRFVTVYDPARKQVTLMDRQEQVQTTISTEDLVKVTAQARAAAMTPAQREQLGIEARVALSQRVVGYTIQFANMEYHTTTQKPNDPAMAADYAMFADLASRLNLIRRIGPPPFGRMTLNQRIAAEREVPLETVLTLRRGEQKEDYRSTHELAELNQNDLDKIKEARGMLLLYRHVDLEDFPK